MRWRLQRGYNFVEVLVTMLLFSTIVMSLASLWINHARAIGKTRSRMVANFLAERTLEECLGRGFTGVNGLDTSDEPDGVEWRVKTTMRGQVIEVPYRFNVRVVDLSPDLKSLTVWVTWPEDNTVKEIRLETLLSRAG
ncbi:MAG: hypothetical protein AB1758_01425 [Candidatus Eremiobacterota bacterium]